MLLIFFRSFYSRTLHGHKPTIRKLNILIANFEIMKLETEYANSGVRSFQYFFGLRNKGKAKNLLCDVIFRLISWGAIEMLSLIPLMFWVLYPLSKHYMSSFLIIMVTGQLIKDIIQLPRPSKQFVVKKELSWETEPGFPSTHVMSAVLPFSVLLDAYRQDMNISTYLWCISITWTVLCGCSRVYMGAHFIMDVVGGLFIAFTISILWYLYGNKYDSFMYDKPSGILFAPAVAILFLRHYPRATPWTASFGTVAIVVGTWMGVSTAMVCAEIAHATSPGSYMDTRPLLLSSSLQIMSYFFGLEINNYSGIGSNEVDGVVRSSILRIVVGLVVVIVVAQTSKTIVSSLLCMLGDKVGMVTFIKSQKQDVDTQGQLVPLRKAYMIEVPCKLITYASLAWTTIVVVPNIWLYFGII